MRVVLARRWSEVRDFVLERPWAAAVLSLGLVLMTWAGLGMGGLPAWLLWLTAPRAAAVGTAITFLAAVPFCFRPEGSAWAHLLMEPDGGLSLAKTQLLLWVTASVAVYGGLSVPVLAPVGFPPSLAGLLGGSVAATALAAAANPGSDDDSDGPANPLNSLLGMMRRALQYLKAPLSKGAERELTAALENTVAGDQLLALVKQLAAAGGREVSDAEAGQALRQAAAAGPGPVRLLDLVEDWRGQGDISRYQFLFLTVLGSTLLLFQFLHTQRAPEVSLDLLYLMGASASGYLGVKGVKTIRKEDKLKPKPR